MDSTTVASTVLLTGAGYRDSPRRLGDAIVTAALVTMLVNYMHVQGVARVELRVKRNQR